MNTTYFLYVNYMQKVYMHNIRHRFFSTFKLALEVNEKTNEVMMFLVHVEV